MSSLIYSCGDFINNGVSYIGTPTFTKISGTYTFTYTAYIGSYLQFQTVSTSNPEMWIKYPDPINVADISKITVTYDAPKSGWNFWIYSYIVNSSGTTLAKNETGHWSIPSGSIDKTSYIIDCSSLTDEAAYLWQRWGSHQPSGAQTAQLRLYSVIGE